MAGGERQVSRGLTNPLCRDRFQQMLQVMQDGMPGTQLIILGIYPRGQDFADNAYMWPNHFTYAIELLNALYEVHLAPTWLVLCAQFQQLHDFAIASAVLGMSTIPCTTVTGGRSARSTT